MAETTPTGIYFPENNIKYQWGNPRRGKTFSTEILQLRNGAEQRRKVYADGPYEYFTGTSIPLTEAQRYTIIDFLESREGQYRNFYFFRPDTSTYVDWYCMDISSQSVFLIPSKDSTITGVKVQDTVQTFTVQAGVGSGGEDQITLTGTPTTTGTVKITGSGRKRIIARLTTDDVGEIFSQTADDLVVATISLKEVR